MSAPASTSLAPFFAMIQKECLPGIWSKGVALSRDHSVKQDSATSEEIILRVILKDRPVSPKVTLWPDDEDWFCDCGDRNEICAHVAACVIALKSGSVSADEATGTEARGGTSAPQLVYRFTRHEGALLFERLIAYPHREVPLTDTLVSYVGGISSGRISSPPIPATREDFAVDAALGPHKRGQLDRMTLRRLLAALAHASGITLDGAPVTTSGKPTGIRASLSDAGEGFKIQGEMDAAITEVFINGGALCGSTLRPVDSPALSPQENEMVSRTGKTFRSPADIAALVSEILPALTSKIPVEIQSQRLPKVRLVEPRIALRLETQDENTLKVIPSIGYGNERAVPGELLLPHPTGEKALSRKLQNELHLSPGQSVTFRGLAAVDFVARAQARAAEWDIEGGGASHFAVQAEITPRLSVSETGFDVVFEASGAGGSASTADSGRVFQAWRNGSSHVPLIGGGFAPLPQDWLDKYGPRISALLSAQKNHGPQKLPPYLLPELTDLSEELHAEIPARLRQLREQLENFEGIPDTQLPPDLRATLRHYQLKGVHWLCFLRESGMGAMLADDMGLGKTLQALCALRGRTLVITPTSVLSGWTGQIAQFRPALKTSTYYGGTRKLDATADITITSYAVLRLDRELLTQEKWGTIILDEAQTIKNPDSQVARAAHALRADFRIALSGTPIENRLDDLWSQFEFLNPGLLGSRTSFQELFAKGAARGEADASARLRARIRPFLLRRLKKEVAPELPPRTETVLHCELGPAEQELYDSILAASRREVVEKLDQGGSVFAALEMLLRLRQACCHPSLVPGQAPQPSSSKLDLLLETLDESISLGHRALIFSQWTSYLDLIEPKLKAAEIGFVRLDGSTGDREAVVRAFQDPAGPPVMLISLKAGGVGLTLTAADHIFLMDPWWNPAVEDQAADRAHRIGQENPVLIHRLVAKDTVEDRILALQKRKLEVAGAVLSDSAAALSITKADILSLFN